MSVYLIKNMAMSIILVTIYLQLNRTIRVYAISI